MTEEVLFQAILAQPPAERAAYLAGHCTDPELRRRVQELLAAHDRLAGALDAPESTGPFDATPSGTVIAPYKLLQLIGQGGMGAVYMAEQTEPVRRMVAVKVVKPGMDSAQVIARFEAERQALALMDHQNIAKVFDAGTTPDGRPFFVMELIRGEPITKFCDANHLTPHERLELFVPVCQAVQHAHQKGVIHRDLKPSNVLVTLYDGRPVPKVIDFGVAKALHQRLTDKTMFTEFGAVVGTLEYMAPEQAELSHLDVDTRSDIYSLGVLLYELLTGSTPVDRKRLRSAAYDEVLRIIREEEPPRPSTRLSQSGEKLPSIAAQRRTEPAKLSKLVRGEIDWIVMKALEKDRGRRYETANGFARDLQRYLADEAVEACPPSTWYRARKLLRKHRTGFATAVAFIVLLVAGAVVSMSLAVKADRARDEAEHQRDVAAEQRRRTRAALDAMTSEVTENALAAQGDVNLAQKAFLTEAATQYERLAGDTADDPEARVDVAGAYLRLGKVHERLGRLAEAEAALRQAADQFAALTDNSRTLGQSLSLQLTALNSLVPILANMGRYAEVDVLVRKMIVLADRLVADHPSEPEFRWQRACAYQALAFANGGVMGDRKFDPRESEAAYRVALALFDDLVRDYPTVTRYRSKAAFLRHNLGLTFLLQGGRQAEAEALIRLAQAELQKVATQEPDNPEYQRLLGRSHNHLGAVLTETGRPAEAAVEFQRSLDVLRPLEGEYPGAMLIAIDVAAASTEYGKLLIGTRKDPEAALDLFVRAVRACQRVLAKDNRRIFVRATLADAQAGRALALTRLGRTAGVVIAAGEVASSPDLDKDGLYMLACVYSLANPKLPPVDTDRAYARTMDFLRRAITAGYRDIAHMLNDPDLSPLRARADYADLLWDLADMPAAPVKP